MPAKRRTWFFVAVALQIAFLLGMTGVHHYTRLTGTPVLLKVLPVDPWDMFRGDYVRLRYEISDVRQPQTVEYRPNERVWVLLSPPGPGERYWQAAGISRDRPAAAAGQVAVRGRVLGHNTWDGVVHMEYGVESFFVPERQGLRLERNPERVEVEIAVDRFGRAGIREVLWDGKPVEFQ